MPPGKSINGTDARPDRDDETDGEPGPGGGSYLGTDDLETLERRRTEELRLIGRYDSSSINPRRECWFLVDTKWLERWAKFVRGEGPPPTKITNEALLQADGKTPREGLKAKVDYRGVNPMVWFLYNEIYGKDSAAEICRYVIDIYELDVPAKYKPEISAGPRKKAKLEIQRMRWRVEPQEAESRPPPKVLGCITEGMIDCFFFNLFTCCRKCCCCRKAQTKVRYKRVSDEEAEEEDLDEFEDGTHEDELDGIEMAEH